MAYKPSWDFKWITIRAPVASIRHNVREGLNLSISGSFRTLGQTYLDQANHLIMKN